MTALLLWRHRHNARVWKISGSCLADASRIFVPQMSLRGSLDKNIPSALSGKNCNMPCTSDVFNRNGNLLLGFSYCHGFGFQVGSRSYVTISLIRDEPDELLDIWKYISCYRGYPLINLINRSSLIWRTIWLTTVKNTYRVWLRPNSLFFGTFMRYMACFHRKNSDERQVWWCFHWLKYYVEFRAMLRWL